MSLAFKKSDSRLVTTSHIEDYYSKLADLKLDHIRVSIELIDLKKIPDVNLFVEMKNENNTSQYRIFRAKGLYLSPIEIQNLIQNDVQFLYLHRSDAPIFTQYIEEILNNQPIKSSLIDEKKVLALRNSAIHVVTEIFENPSKENIDRGIKTVSTFVYLIMKDPKAYELLFNLSSHDPYTLQHSVGVATTAIILAKKIGYNDEESLIEVGIGGLLHDIGKTMVPKEIINKPGPLDESEWVIMKKHSIFGHEIIKDNINIGTRAKLAILEHHEDEHGTGYPFGLAGKQVTEFAKIVALVDIFNAITTDRTYSKAKPPFEAFQIIREKLKQRVEPKLFEALVKIYGGKI